MVRFLTGAFLASHGWIHVAIYMLPAPADGRQPFDPAHSWALTGLHVGAIPARHLSARLAAVTAALFTLAAVGVWVGAGWWFAAAALASASGLGVKSLYFHPWLTLGIVLDAAILLAVFEGWPPSLT